MLGFKPGFTLTADAEQSVHQRAFSGDWSTLGLKYEPVVSFVAFNERAP